VLGSCQFFKTCLLVKTIVFTCFSHSSILKLGGAYNQSVAPGTTRPICMPLFVTTADLNV